ncbi:bll0010 [Bradyrhizobium diazoefficiens USDA 110]|jgi:hypothetical protein|uniref:Bll0010 protein n=2 Tax=Bradyrhizobium TaxID=374 RepID=Q89YE2_BRADU|nr:hypothetical protein RN69_00050 [Bradyrhizobium japonicum]AND93135.1 hypothetical protein AAV28_39315 [Bradyrhizobium diazoefficiens USDA 110]APO48570.1 hypothetical protein BD122_00045 [Bradyrhizobium diazoefficiens]AWL93315.1 hypothetical protein CIT37_14765 [Bradyrhizobium ottawaense]NLS75081.1 hypothetical protein [Bradyrhizobium brasilense]NWL43629.1 hypothetical protein [Bradyrhizobium elkanii]QHP74040.1 hypothetical protein EI171_00975 [Bradyrhizobium sp. LCT2]QOZ14365.1 hypothetic
MLPRRLQFSKTERNNMTHHVDLGPGVASIPAPRNLPNRSDQGVSWNKSYEAINACGQKPLLRELLTQLRQPAVFPTMARIAADTTDLGVKYDEGTTATFSLDRANAVVRAIDTPDDQSMHESSRAIPSCVVQ